MPRSAVKVNQSKSAYLEEQQAVAVDLERQLSLALSQSDPAGGGGAPQQHDRANQLRVPLCETLSDLLLTSPAFAVQHGVLERLWNHCFYSRIGPQRARVARERKRQQQQAAAGNSKTALVQLEKAYHQFLVEAITLYIYLAEQLQSKLVASTTNNNKSTQQDNEDTQSQSASWMTGTQSTGPSFVQAAGSQSYQTQAQVAASNHSSTAEDRASIVECLYGLYVHLGDLYRYADHLTRAEAAYTTATRLAPGHGHAYNQWAVLSQVQDSGTAPQVVVALCWYARSLLCTHKPFVTAQVNVIRLLKTNQKWLAEQSPAQLDSCNKSTATRVFLAQFVELYRDILRHHIFTDDEQQDGRGDQEEIQTQGYLRNNQEQKMLDLMDRFTQLLKNSSMGDALLCKLVTIASFCETLLRQNQVLTVAKKKTRKPPPSANGDGRGLPSPQVQTAAWYQARTALLHTGHALAERMVLSLQKWQQAANAKGPQPPPSIRLAVPLLLLTEYLVHHPTSASFHGQGRSPRKKDLDEANIEETRHDEARELFWRKLVEVLNLLLRVREATQAALATKENGGNDDAMDDFDEEDSAQLKEYQQLRGYAPFADFLKPLSSAGFVTDVEAVEALENASGPAATQAQPPRGGSAASTSVVSQPSASTAASSTSNPLHQARIKVGRFLAVGRRVVAGAAYEDEKEHDAWVAQHIDWDESNREFVWMEDEFEVEVQHDDDDDERAGGDVSMWDAVTHSMQQQQEQHMNGASGRNPTAMEEDDDEAGDQIFMYKPDQKRGGGPALLVPTSLLQVPKADSTTQFKTKAVSESVITEPTMAPPPPSLTAGLVGGATRASSLGAAQEKLRETTPQPLPSILPPPGFGGTAPAQAPTQHQFMPPGFTSVPPAQPQVPSASVLGHAPLGAFHRPQAATNLLDSSYDLFGGASAFHPPSTVNPFATTSMMQPSTLAGADQLGAASSSLDNLVPRLQTTAGQQQQSSFLGGPHHHHHFQQQQQEQDDVVGLDEAALLDSSLLSSLLMDDATPRKTKNPFAT